MRLITILGPTATGKTALAANLAHVIHGEVISADSRQVYRGMNIGTGKDYEDYFVGGVQIPCHLIDIVDPGYEYNIFEYQQDFLKAYRDITERNKVPVLCGGSGMYLEAILKGYRLSKAGSDDKFLESLRGKTDAELVELLKSYTTPHNITDFEDRPRLLKAVRVAVAHDPGTSFPEIRSDIFGISFPRGLVKTRITERLEHRLKHGLIEEVAQLLQGGITPERLMKYGLEYKFVTLFLAGKLSREKLMTDLNIAIRQFAKRQMTWFRRMEKHGMKITWIDGRLPLEKKIEVILASGSPSR
jgi:tRNA dimethylallyltransferase